MVALKGESLSRPLGSYREGDAKNKRIKKCGQKPETENLYGSEEIYRGGLVESGFQELVWEVKVATKGWHLPLSCT